MGEEEIVEDIKEDLKKGGWTLAKVEQWGG